MKNLFYSTAIVFALILSSCSDDDDAKPQEITVSTEGVETLGATIKFSEVASASYYDVELSEDGKDYEYIESVMTDKLSYELEDLKAGTKYQVKVLAKNITDKTLGEGNVSFTTVEAVSELAGTWVYTYETYKQTYIFNTDGTGEYKESTGSMRYDIKWYAEEPTEGEAAKLTITTYTNGYDGPSMTKVVDYIYYGEGESINIDDTIYFPEI